MECLWGHGKQKFLETIMELLPSHLDLFPFTYKFKEVGFFEKFMEILGKNYFE